jgi:archaea-specific DNA-binding protein
MQEEQETTQKSDERKEDSKETAEKKRSEKDNTIFVGIKPFMNYVTGVVMQFKTKGQKEVIVSARGKFISKAVDIVEVARRTFLKEENIAVKDIKISSEDFENKEGKRIHVSAIEIYLIKPE